MARLPLSRILPSLIGAGLFSLAGAGCVSQEDYAALKADRDNLAEQYAEANTQAHGNRKLAETYRAQLASVGDGRNAEGALLTNYQQQIANLQAEHDALLSKYEQMLSRIGTGPALPELLTSELTRFAAENPDLVSFDAKAGIVKFRSDVTFASGDAELTPEARSVIGRFAQILNSPVARQYELRVAGHTDNVPVSNPLTRSKGHKDNWYLSSHRAISVAESLMGQGVDKSRLGVTGFADQRPVAENTSDTGRQQNRRVEVLILPSTVSQPQPASLTAAAPAAAEQRPEPRLPIDDLSK